MRKPIFAAALVALGTAACSDDPPSPSQVRSRITDDLGNVLRETNASATALDAQPGSAALHMVDRVFSSQSSTISPRLSHKLTNLRALVAPRTDVRSADGGVRPADNNDLIDTDETIAFLTDRVFTDANETSPGVYTLPPGVVCGDDTGTIDQECATQLAKLDLRIAVSERDAALVFAI